MSRKEGARVAPEHDKRHNYKSFEESRYIMAMQQHQYNDDQMDGLIISIVPELGRRIKRAAAQSNIPVQEYVGQVLDQVVPAEANTVEKHRGGLNRAAIEELKRYREEVRRAHPGAKFEDSVELLRQAREERTKELEER